MVSVNILDKVLTCAFYLRIGASVHRCMGAWVHGWIGEWVYEFY